LGVDDPRRVDGCITDRFNGSYWDLPYFDLPYFDLPYFDLP